MQRSFAGLFAASLFALPVLAADGRQLDRTVALDANGTVSIHTFKGSVTVETWDRAQAQVSAAIEPDTSCGTAAEQQERVRLTEIDIESSPSRLELRSDYDRLKGLESLTLAVEGHEYSCSAHPFVHYRLRVPATARLEVEDHKSKIDVVGLRSEARIRSHKGSIDVKDHDGRLDLTTHKGDVRVAFARFSADSRLETYKGEIEIAMPRGAGFDLDGRVERGSLDASFDLETQMVGRRERVYEQKVNGGGPALSVETKKGSIRLR